MVSQKSECVFGMWTVPPVGVPINTPVDIDGGWEAATWVGIGDNTEVLQAGVSGRVTSEWGATEYWAWYEWYVEPPDGTSWQEWETEFPYVNEVPIAMSVGPGDSIMCYVQYTSINGQEVGSLWFENATSGKYFAQILQPPTGAAKNGAANWIVERPTFLTGTDQVRSELPTVGPVTFEPALGCGDTLAEPQSGDDITMQDEYGNGITTTLLGSDFVIVDYVAPPPIGPFDELRISCQTGGDNLRGDSGLTAVLTLQGYRQDLTVKTKAQPEWKNNSLNEQTFTLSGPVMSSALPGSLEFTLIQNTGGFLETSDEWDLESIAVWLIDSTGTNEPFLVLARTGDPDLNVFSENEPSLVMPLD